MDTKNLTQQRISALSDSEWSEEDIALALADLRQPEGRAIWDLYHQIGDIMRSDEMAQGFSKDFTARLMARLDAEPTVVAPMLRPSVEKGLTFASIGVGAKTANSSFRRYAVPSVAAAAAAAFVLIAGPQFVSRTKGGGHTDTLAPIMVISKAHVDAPLEKLASVSAQQPNPGAPLPDGVILRDPRIDEYLLAHQRFSPSLYSAAQYARSAAFASDSDK